MADYIIDEGDLRGMKMRDMGDGSFALVVAAGSASVATSSRQAISSQQIQSAQLASARGLDVPQNATMASIQNTGNLAARWRPDANPTAMQGQRIDPGDTLYLDIGHDGLLACRFIGEDSGAVLDVVYFG